MNEELQAIDDASDAIEITRKGRFAEIKLHNGIVIGVKPLPPLLLQTIGAKFKTPDPPVVYMEEKGREEPNPNDPAYLQLLQVLEEQQELATQNLVLGAATHLVSVPDGYDKPEDPGWKQSVEFAAELAGQTLDLDTSTPVKQYLCWLRFYAMETGADVALVQALPFQLAGIREGEVQAALESFHGISERGTDSEDPTPIRSEDGNTTNRAARRAGARNRGTRSRSV